MHQARLAGAALGLIAVTVIVILLVLLLLVLVLQGPAAARARAAMSRRPRALVRRPLEVRLTFSDSSSGEVY